MALYNLLLLILFSPPIISIQIPLQRHSPPSDSNPSFIFTSLHGLLRQAPNTFSPNGFSILPGTVPAYTNLYHARKDSGDIPKIEWVAFDAEMSYGIMGGRGGETWLHTYVTTRDVRVLVFDGMSAALGGSGTLDSQSVFLYGEVKNETRRRGRQRGPVFDEYTRAADLCKWAEKLGGGGIEGFVRMNTGFEMVWCDFEKSESWRLVSKLNVTAPYTREQQREDALDEEGPRPPPGRPGHGYGPPGRGYGYGPPGGMPWSNAAGWEWIRSATWHYSLSPESRVTPDFCRFFTFYSPSFESFPNTLTTRKNSSHRLTGVSKPDAAAFKTAIGESLLSTAPCSGLNWRRVTQDIMDHYGGRIKEISLVLSANATNATEKVEKAGKLAFAGVMPFVNNSLPTEVEERCTRAFTEFIPEASLSPQEFLLRDTMEAVLGRICRLFVDVYFEYVQPKLPAEDNVRIWRRNTEALIGWLDWDMWRMCEERCRWDEVCAMALWPVLGLMDSEEWSKPRCINSSTIERRGRRRGPPPGPGRDEGPEPDAWTVLEL
ncbi:hypothetical protein K440DRAFT_426420 [Wilcoxina mikolae CBS 423.85]|nr:hypothetical protein K440DRAFT_426420 [Wilcoxina mikolae CBS 423.85]